LAEQVERSRDKRSRSYVLRGIVARCKGKIGLKPDSTNFHQKNFLKSDITN